MAVVRRPGWSRAVALVVGLALGAVAARSARADQIVLRGGGQIRGKVIADPKKPGRVTVLTETGKTPLSFQKAQVVRVVPEPSALDEYLVRREKADGEAEAQYQLGLWCEEHKLPDLASVHFEAAVSQDKSFGPAHQKLGHVLYGERWLTSDELREAQGMVRYKGRWVMKEERDRREAMVAAGAKHASWVRRIRQIREVYIYGTDERRQEAEQKFLEIIEPEAVVPLVLVLGDDPAAVRMLLDQVLGSIPGREASDALVSRILFESDSEVRQSTLTELERREDPKIITNLVGALRSNQPEIVNRAAWTLASLDAVAAVPKLVSALLTTQYRVVMVPSGGSSGGGLPSGPVLGSVPIYTNGSSTAFLTPPAVGPGVAAYGATQVPYSYGGFSASMGSVTASRGPMPRLLAFTYQNVEVLAALVKMTGRNFGYDISAWRQWVSTSFHPDKAPVRRVPQP